MKASYVLALATFLCAASAVGAQQRPRPAAQAASLGPMAPRLQNLVGTWRVKAELRFAPGAQPRTIDAIAENRLIGNRWLVSELKGSMEKDGGFHGVGVNGYDPAQGKYVGYWIDNTRSLLIPVEGVYDADAHVFRTTSTERNAQGRSTTVVSETRILGPDEEVTTFTAHDAKGRPFTRMVLSYHKER